MAHTWPTHLPASPEVGTLPSSVMDSEPGPEVSLGVRDAGPWMHGSHQFGYRSSLSTAETQSFRRSSTRGRASQPPATYLFLAARHQFRVF